MYSVVLMMALTTGGDATMSRHHGGCGCEGGHSRHHGCGCGEGSGCSLRLLQPARLLRIELRLVVLLGRLLHLRRRLRVVGRLFDLR